MKQIVKKNLISRAQMHARIGSDVFGKKSLAKYKS